MKISTGVLLLQLAAFSTAEVACTKKANEHVTGDRDDEGHPNAASTQSTHEGGSGSVGDQLPAGGNATGGQGNTQSNTSAASGAVQDDSMNSSTTNPVTNPQNPTPQGTSSTNNSEESGTAGSPR